MKAQRILISLLVAVGSQAFTAERRPRQGPTSSQHKRLFLADGSENMKNDQSEFWAQQRELIGEMKDKQGKKLKVEQLEKFETRRLALVGDTAYFGFFIFCSTSNTSLLVT